MTSERAPFRTKLLQWAARWNLRDEWILDHAPTTLLHWLQQPCDVGLKWRLDSHYFISPDDFLGAPKLQIDETWHFEPWKQVEGRIMARIAKFKSAVERYSAVVAFDPQDAGTSLHHYEWLALYQCKGYSAGRIQKWHKETHQESVVESTITHAIDSRADRIGLTKRKSKRGNGKSKT